MTARARVRTWQELRMPDYDSRHVDRLAAAFAKSAGVAPGDGPPPPAASDAQRIEGAGFIGTDPRTKGMGCIGCHDWGRNKSLGEEAPQLINAAERLRYDWYHRWMRNPGRILSGTSMPNYFSGMAPAAANGIINSLWAAMSLGERMPVPAGFENTGSERRRDQARTRQAADRSALGHAWGHARRDCGGNARERLVLFRCRRIAAALRLARRFPRSVRNALQEDRIEQAHAHGEARGRRVLSQRRFPVSLRHARPGTALSLPRLSAGRWHPGVPLRGGRRRGHRVDHAQSRRGRPHPPVHGEPRRPAPMWFVDGGRRIDISRGDNVRFTVEVGTR